MRPLYEVVYLLADGLSPKRQAKIQEPKFHRLESNLSVVWSPWSKFFASQLGNARDYTSFGGFLHAHPSVLLLYRV